MGRSGADFALVAGAVERGRNLENDVFVALEEFWGQGACLDRSVCGCLRHGCFFLSILVVFVGVSSQLVLARAKSPHLRKRCR